MNAGLFLFLAVSAYGIYRLGCAVHDWSVRRDAIESDPVVVTASGHRSNRYPRSCGGAR